MLNIVNLHYLSEEEKEKIKNDKNYRYFPKRDIIIYTDEQQEQLLKDYPTLAEYFEYYDDDYIDYYIFDTLEGYLQFEIFEKSSNDFEMMIYASDLINKISLEMPYLENDLLKNEEPEKFLDSYINGSILLLKENDL